MMQKLKSYIKEKNWENILNYCKDLNESQRSDTIKYLRSLNIDKDIIGKEVSTLAEYECVGFYADRQSD